MKNIKAIIDQESAAVIFKAQGILDKIEAVIDDKDFRRRPTRLLHAVFMLWCAIPGLIREIDRLKEHLKYAVDAIDKVKQHTIAANDQTVRVMKIAHNLSKAAGYYSIRTQRLEEETLDEGADGRFTYHPGTRYLS